VAESRLRYDAERAEVELVASAPVASSSELASACPALKARRRRWAELLRLVFQVDVEACPRCGGEARIVAFVTEPRVVRRILAYLERRGAEARAGFGVKRGGRKGVNSGPTYASSFYDA
jgi:hypothetical protein